MNRLFVSRWFTEYQCTSYPLLSKNSARQESSWSVIPETNAWRSCLIRDRLQTVFDLSILVRRFGVTIQPFFDVESWVALLQPMNRQHRQERLFSRLWSVR